MSKETKVDIEGTSFPHPEQLHIILGGNDFSMSTDGKFYNKASVAQKMGMLGLLDDMEPEDTIITVPSSLPSRTYEYVDRLIDSGANIMITCKPLNDYDIYNHYMKFSKYKGFLVSNLIGWGSVWDYEGNEVGLKITAQCLLLSIAAVLYRIASGGFGILEDEFVNRKILAEKKISELSQDYDGLIALSSAVSPILGESVSNAVSAIPFDISDICRQRLAGIREWRMHWASVINGNWQNSYMSPEVIPIMDGWQKAQNTSNLADFAFLEYKPRVDGADALRELLKTLYTVASLVEGVGIAKQSRWKFPTNRIETDAPELIHDRFEKSGSQARIEAVLKGVPVSDVLA